MELGNFAQRTRSAQRGGARAGLPQRGFFLEESFFGRAWSGGNDVSASSASSARHSLSSARTIHLQVCESCIRGVCASQPRCSNAAPMAAQATGRLCGASGNWSEPVGVDRFERSGEAVDLRANDATRQQIRFHDLRATGIIWMVVRGDDHLKIRYRAGHEDFSTTQEYIRAAEAIRDGFGDVFPPIPDALFLPGILSEWVGANGHAYGIIRQKQSGRRDLNPRQRAPKARALPDCATPRCER